MNILETSSTNGIFSNYADLQNLIRSEYLDEVERGETKNGIRSEDLQNLTLKNNSVDILISLDVFEHIADPIKAFSEVNRVLSKNGFAIITVPIDKRQKETKQIASFKDEKIVYYKEPSYHSDPLREDGALVFTEFGLNIVDDLKSLGYKVIMEQYSTYNSHIIQHVLVIKK